jgi:hypothetical protein
LYIPTHTNARNQNWIYLKFHLHRPVWLIFLPCTTSRAIFNPVFKASRSMVFAPFFNKGMAALKSPPKILKTRHRQTKHLYIPTHTNARNQNWIYLKFHLYRPVWLMGIGSRKDWHRL